MITTEICLDCSARSDLGFAQVDRLASKILDVFNLACDLEDVNAAQDLLKVAEAVLSRDGMPLLKQWDQVTQCLVDAHYRLWELRYFVR